jgi:hypothetical protein
MYKTVAAIIAVLVLAIGAGVYLWQQREAVKPEPLPPVAAPAVTPPPAPAPEPEPAIKHPIDSLAVAEPTEQPLPKLDRSDSTVRATLADWLGRKSVESFLQLDDFVRHAVATVDNLGRSHAAPRLWPVNPMPGRYTVAIVGDGTFATPGNAERYSPFVTFVEGVDSKRAVALYARWYPLFQQAYEELGYPGKYFNDRLVEVVDLLIATPVPEAPLELKLTEVKGPIPVMRPWLRYEFADPKLEALPAGQKMLLRMGPANQKRLQAKLAEVRRQLTTNAPKR